MIFFVYLNLLFGSETSPNLHEHAECTPCIYYHNPKGCVNGDTCQFCHDCFAGEDRQWKKIRKENRKLIQTKRLLWRTKVSREIHIGEQFETQSKEFLHLKGECTPCGYFNTARGCPKGKECRLCHFCVKGEREMIRQASSRSWKKALRE